MNLLIPPQLSEDLRTVNTYTMSRVCVSKNFIYPLSFSDWVKQKNNLYVGHSLAKYSQGLKEDSIWCPRKIFSEHPGKFPISRLHFYEQWIREECDISPLIGLNLGCWCPPGQLCHVDVLVRVIHEHQRGIFSPFIFEDSADTPEKKEEEVASQKDDTVQNDEVGSFSLESTLPDPAPIYMKNLYNADIIVNKPPKKKRLHPLHNRSKSEEYPSTNFPKKSKDFYL